jgi:hypothetical protein
MLETRGGQQIVQGWFKAAERSQHLLWKHSSFWSVAKSFWSVASCNISNAILPNEARFYLQLPDQD